MGEFGEKEKRQIDCLIADFGAIKSEIGRRSNLQRVVIAAYLAVMVFIFQQVASDNIMIIWVAVLWWSAALTITYYFREDLEIHRLGSIIKNNIAPIISKSIQASALELFPSENEYDKTYLKFTRPYDIEFNWSIFFLFPMVMSGYIISHQKCFFVEISCLCTTTPWVLILAVIATTRTLWLLIRHSRKKDRWLTTG